MIRTAGLSSAESGAALEFSSALVSSAICVVVVVDWPSWSLLAQQSAPELGVPERS